RPVTHTLSLHDALPIFQDDRLHFINNVVEQIALIDNPIEREHYLNELANEYNIRIEALVEQIESIRQKLGIHRDKREQNRYTNRDRKSTRLNSCHASIS